MVYHTALSLVRSSKESTVARGAIACSATAILVLQKRSLANLTSTASLASWFFAAPLQLA